MPGGWVHRFFKLYEGEDETAVIEMAGGTDITDDNIKTLTSKVARLENNLGTAAPKVVCRFCNLVMSWEPSTKRKAHLFKCGRFLATSDAKDHSQFQRERSDWIEKQANAAQVRTLSDATNCTAVQSGVAEFLRFVAKFKQVLQFRLHFCNFCELFAICFCISLCNA
jgi:hypothetical protein